MKRLHLPSALLGIWVLFGVPYGTADDKQTPSKPLSPAVAAMLRSSPEDFIKHFDKNKDGLLTRDELTGRIASAFERIDTNHDGKLDAREIAVMLETLRSRFGLPRESRPSQNTVESEVAKILQGSDRNHDNKLSRDEASARLSEHFEKYDANKDGFLDRSELRLLVEALLANQGGAGTPAAKPALPDFDTLDQNADGRITKDELKGTPYLAAFDEIDANKDGKLSPREWEAFVKKQAESAK